MATTDRHTEELRTFAHLAGLLAADFPRDVLARRLRIVVGERVLEHTAGQALVLTVGRLAPRFCHRVDFHAPTQVCLARLRPLLATEAFSSESLAALARLIWPDGEFTNEGDAAADVILGIGAPGDVSVGIDAAGSAVVAQGVVPVEHADAVFAALLAAGLACAQTAKLLYPEILGTAEGSEIRFPVGPLGDTLEPVGPIVLERPVFAGVGAVGCAAVYALIVAGAVGHVLLLDPDVVKDSSVLRDILLEHKMSAPGQLVVGRGHGRHPFNDTTVAKRALRAWRRANLEPITLHEARHTFASLMIAAGVNAKALTTYMGHASVTITYDRYGHLMPGNENEAAALLDAYLERANTRARLAAVIDR